MTLTMMLPMLLLLVETGRTAMATDLQACLRATAGPSQDHCAYFVHLQGGFYPSRSSKKNNTAPSKNWEANLPDK